MARNKIGMKGLKRSLFDLEMTLKDILGVISHLFHIKALRVMQLCAKFYKAASRLMVACDGLLEILHHDFC